MIRDEMSMRCTPAILLNVIKWRGFDNGDVKETWKSCLTMITPPPPPPHSHLRDEARRNETKSDEMSHDKMRSTYLAMRAINNHALQEPTALFRLRSA